MIALEVKCNKESREQNIITIGYLIKTNTRKRQRKFMRLIVPRERGKKSGKRLRQMMLPSLAKDYIITTNDMQRATKDRRKWKPWQPMPIMGMVPFRERSYQRTEKSLFNLEYIPYLQTCSQNSINPESNRIPEENKKYKSNQAVKGVVK